MSDVAGFGEVRSRVRLAENWCMELISWLKSSDYDTPIVHLCQCLVSLRLEIARCILSVSYVLRARRILTPSPRQGYAFWLTNNNKRTLVSFKPFLC